MQAFSVQINVYVQRLVYLGLYLLKDFSFYLAFFRFLEGIVYFSSFVNFGLRPEGWAREDFILDRRRDIAVSCTFILFLAFWSTGNILQFVFLPNDT